MITLCLFPNILIQGKLSVLFRRGFLLKINIFCQFGKKCLLRERIFAKNGEDLWGFYRILQKFLLAQIYGNFTRYTIFLLKMGSNASINQCNCVRRGYSSVYSKHFLRFVSWQKYLILNAVLKINLQKKKFLCK